MFEWLLGKKNKRSDHVRTGRNIHKDLVLLLILDGFGIHPDPLGNAVYQAKTPFLDLAWSKGISTLITASGKQVGLPDFEAGNSEVGHINLGSGQIVSQSLPLINNAIKSGAFGSLPELNEAFKTAKERKSKLHITGLLSAGGVHGHIEHIFEVMKLAKEQGIDPYIHVMLDGRDTGLTDGYFYLSKLAQKIRELGVGKIASIAGRFYSMDRDTRWERTQLAYDCMIGNGKRKAIDPFMVLQDAYKAGENDQVFVPTTMVDTNGKAIGAIENEDVVIFTNFREDRARQLTKAFVLDEIPGMVKINPPKNLHFLTMTGYEDDLQTHVLFPPKKITDTLASVVSANGKKQLHISETEKFAHVTYFFNGGHAGKYEGEQFYQIPSPKVFDYAKVPEMSSEIITDQLVFTLENWEKFEYSFIVANFANPDMLGHTGNLEATIKANELCDNYAKRVTEAVIARGGCVVILADHGNCETMINRVTMQVDTAHTNNPVPFIILCEKSQIEALPTDSIRKIGISADGSVGVPTGILADVAPTILSIMGMPAPDSMTGVNLLEVI